MLLYVPLDTTVIMLHYNGGISLKIVYNWTGNSDSTVKKKGKKKDVDSNDEPPSYPAPLPPDEISGNSDKVEDTDITKQAPVNQLQGLLLEELKIAVQDNKAEQLYENAVVTESGQIKLFEAAESSTDEPLRDDQSDDKESQKAEPILKEENVLSKSDSNVLNTEPKAAVVKGKEQTKDKTSPSKGGAKSVMNKLLKSPKKGKRAKNQG